MLAFDAEIRQDLRDDCHLIGLDEVGRGSLIGPVTAGAVCFHTAPDLKQRKLLKWLNDSKQVGPEVRAELAKAIHAIAWVGIGEASKDEVDRLNIHYASLLATHRAFENLFANAGIARKRDNIFLLLDGRAIIPDYDRQCQKAVVKGDGKSASIAAASIVAKEHRDSYIKTLAVDYPGYGWETNMGYNTAAHQNGLNTLGLTPLHRKNFRAVIDQMALALDFD